MLFKTEFNFFLVAGPTTPVPCVRPDGAKIAFEYFSWNLITASCVAKSKKSVASVCLAIIFVSLSEFNITLSKDTSSPWEPSFSVAVKTSFIKLGIGTLKSLSLM